MTRGASFEEVICGHLVAIEKHPRFEHQKILLFYYRHYVWAVPFVEDEDSVFLKTLYRSRKWTQMYLRGDYEKSKTDEI